MVVERLEVHILVDDSKRDHFRFGPLVYLTFRCTLICPYLMFYIALRAPIDLVYDISVIFFKQAILPGSLQKQIWVLGTIIIVLGHPLIIEVFFILRLHQCPGTLF